MRLTVLSRASDLARAQAQMVGRALSARWPDLDIHYLTRTSAGDRDGVTPLAGFTDKGAFTTDLSDALHAGDADLVVHSWKDLPIEDRAGTEVVATLERADPRDVLLVRTDVADAKPATLTVLSSSPRRTWLLGESLPAMLPWKVTSVRDVPVRGNIPTRLKRLLEKRADALVVAKAALDRLIESDVASAETKQVVRDAIDHCRWMVLPLREHPSAPAQGALAIEVPASKPDVIARVRAINHEPTWRAVQRERAILAEHGGGCHAALGATVLVRDFGVVTSVRARLSDTKHVISWSLEGTAPTPPRVPSAALFPRPDERRLATRRPLDATMPPAGVGLFVTRADALPDSWTLDPDRIVWVSGSRTWRNLAERGVWVNGSADGLGLDVPAIEALTGRSITWRRLTHADAADQMPDTLATYAVDEPLPADLGSRTHFFWSSGTAFLHALRRERGIRDGWHGCGPGRTWQTLRDTLGETDRLSVWLDYDHWREGIRR